MNWKELKTEEDYNKAALRLMEIFHAEPNTPEDTELGILGLLIKDYEDINYSMPKLNTLENA